MSRPRKKHVQLSLDAARQPDGKHGGWRPNAGRKRKPGAMPHDPRPELNARYPKHVTVRVRDDVGSLATEFLMKKLRTCIQRAQKDTFRIVEFNVLTNHLHLIIEAADRATLTRGVQGFLVRTAKNLNSAMKRTGKVFEARYHLRELRTPTETRNALRYVLLNRKHHDRKKRFSKTWFDPFSSAAWFEGWADPLYANAGWQHDLLHSEKPTANAQTWLLRIGGKQLGLLHLDDRPR